MGIREDQKSYNMLLIEASAYLNQAANYLNNIMNREETQNLIVVRASLKGLSKQVLDLTKNNCEMLEIQKVIRRVDKFIDQIPPIPMIMQNVTLARENLIRAMAYC